MSKRVKNKKSSQIKPAKPELAHNPFAALSQLGDSLPALADAPEPPSVEPEPEAPTPFPNKLVVRMEKKGRRGKTVTCIAGVPAAKLKELSVSMKKALGCGATVEDGQIVLQGSLVERAAAWLEKAGAQKIVKGN